MEKAAKQKKKLTPGIIMLPTLFMYVLYIAAQRVFIAFPCSSDTIRRLEAQSPAAQEAVVDNLWAYYLINRENPLSRDFTVGLAEVQNGFMLDERCVSYAKRMIADAHDDGIELCVVSAYRSPQKQQENLDSYVSRLRSQGLSSKDAQLLAEREIQLPYMSEHNAGLALDILTDDWWLTHDDVTRDFENTEQFRWLSEHAHEYGFIMRYPEEYEDITGIIYEPWHYRFVGLYYAKKIKDSGQPFEYFYKMNF